MKRYLSILIGVLMLLTLLIGCSSQGNTGDRDQNQPSGAEQKPLEISWWIPTGEDATYYSSYEENPAVRYLESLTYQGKKIKLRFTVPIAGAEAENFNTLLATESYDDIMTMTYSTVSAAELYEDGVIYDLTDYVETYMPNYLAVLNANPMLHDQLYCSVNGEKKILTLCSVTDGTIANFMGWLYRRDWVAKYGTNPATGQAFTYGYTDPNDPDSWHDDIVFPSGGTDPVYISDWEWMFGIFEKALQDLKISDGYSVSIFYKGYLEDGSLFTAFGGGAPLWYRDKDGNAAFNGDSESMKSYLSCLHAWYEKGWLDKAFAEHSSDQAYSVDSSKVHSGKVGMWVGRRAEVGNAMDMGDEYTSGVMVYAARQPINDMYGAKETRNQTPYSLYQNSRIRGTQTVSTKVAEENLPALLTFLDYFYSPEGGALLALGLTEEQVRAIDDPTYAKFNIPYGYKINTLADGTVEYERHPVSVEDNDLATALAGKRLPIGYYGPGIIPAMNRGYGYYANLALAQWDYYENTGYPDKTTTELFTAEESSTFSKVHANVDTYMSTTIPKFINGKSDLNGSDWTDYKKMLKKYGPQKVTDIYQKYFSAFPKKEAEASEKTSQEPSPFQDIAGTYTCMVYTSENKQGVDEFFHNVFLRGLNPATQTNTLVLKEDGTYEYTKLFSGSSSSHAKDGSIILETVFYGLYNAEDSVVLLNYPDEAVWKHDWAFYSSYVTSSSGTATDGDMIEGVMYPRYYFAGKYYAENPETEKNPIAVTVNQSDHSFIYGGDAANIIPAEGKEQEVSGSPCAVHRWNALTGRCKICGAACEHPMWNTEEGQCLTCKMHCDHETGKHDQQQHCIVCGKMVPHHFFNGVCDCGVKAPYGFECEETPSEYKVPCSEKGTVERLEYGTYAYDNQGNKGNAVTKACYVYLPYGYDETKPYNVLYLYHGTSSSETYWFGMENMEKNAKAAYGEDSCPTLSVLDHLIQNGEMEPTLVVTPTLYTNGAKIDEDVLHYEIVNDLIPAVESRYSTYAGRNVSSESLIASRRHRAMGGLSAGSRLTRTTLPYVQEYMSWFASMSRTGDLTPNYFDAVKKKAEQGYAIDMYYHGIGFSDEYYMEQKSFVQEMFQLDPNGEVFTEKNLVFVDKNENKHTFRSWLSDLYNIGRVFFKDAK